MDGERTISISLDGDGRLDGEDARPVRATIVLSVDQARDLRDKLNAEKLGPSSRIARWSAGK